MIFSMHIIGDFYLFENRNGTKEYGWKLAYSHPITGTYKKGQWVEYAEPYALIEKPVNGGIDIREIPARFLKRDMQVNIF
jgi:hypothetical protein